MRYWFDKNGKLTLGIVKAQRAAHLLTDEELRAQYPGLLDVEDPDPEADAGDDCENPQTEADTKGRTQTRSKRVRSWAP
jgi:hypothetical protein